jgi:hypothetical protein
VEKQQRLLSNLTLYQPYRARYLQQSFSAICFKSQPVVLPNGPTNIGSFLKNATDCIIIFKN